MKNKRGITLISLVITIIVLIILASVSIYLSLGNNGIFNKAQEARELTNKQEATEKINLKITTAQMNKYAKKQEMPSLQELADVLYEDDEIQYVTLESKVADKEKVIVGEKTSIYTKLNEYPYEFEINSSLQLASIDGIQVATSNNTTSKMHSPIHLITAELPSTLNNDLREAGEYKASSTAYNKTASANMEKYLSFKENKGWTILKDGWYYIQAQMAHSATSSNWTRLYGYLYINSVKFDIMHGMVALDNTTTYYYPVLENFPMYFNKGDVIDFTFETNLAGRYSSAKMSIYALFE